MGRCRIVRPDTVRLSLSDGDYIDVKKELNAGESRKVFADMVKEQRFGEPASVDMAKVGLTQVMAYLVGWSFVDLQDKPLVLSESAALSLDNESFLEMKDAIDTHVKTVSEAKEAEKNALATASASSPISISAAP